LVNEDFEKDTESWFHHYKLVHVQDSNKIIDCLQLLFVELPKFKAKNYQKKKLSVYWLRYLVELENMTEMINEDLLSVPEIKKAIELTKESYYSRAELDAYDKYWDSISTEKSFIADAEAKGEARGEARGKIEKETEIVCRAYVKSKDIEFVAEITSLSNDQVLDILKKNGLM
jgi:predicted transposase/invertase (TIGR01784 family)